MKKYQVDLVFIQNEVFEMPVCAEFFVIEAGGIEQAVKVTDQELYKFGVTGHKNDFSDHNYNFELTSCNVWFGDADTGQSILYKIEEIQ